MDNFEAFDGVFDFNSFINFPEDTNMESNNNVDFQFPTMDDFSTDVLNFSDMSPLPDLVFSQYDANVNSFDTSEYPASSVNESPLTANSDSFAPQAEDFRYLVDSRASADQRTRSMKQKRRDAAIDLHLERFMNLHSDAQLFPIDSEFSFSDTPSFTYSHESSRQSPVASTPVSSTSSSDQSTAPQVGGRELVFDINLNTATNLPKKQKKRTKAQIEDYINARRNGACLKHKKQHKKCNCHEKKAAKNTMDVKARKRRTPLSKAPVPTPGLMPNTPSETPSTVSRSSFSPSVYSQLDSQSFHEEIDSALASLDDLNDLERWVSLETYAPTADMSHQQYSQTESHGFSSPVHHRTVNTPVSTNLQTNVGYLAGGDESFNHLLGLTNDMSHGSLNTGQLVTTAGVPRLTEGTSSQTQNTSPVRTGVSLSSQHLLPNAPVQLSAPVQQGLPTTSVQVQPVTSPRRTEDSSALMWNNSPVRPGVALSSTLALPNAQQQPSTPVPQELSTGSSSGKPATSSLLPVSQGLPMETSVPVSNLPGWERQAGPLSTLPSRASLLSSQPSIGTASPVPSGLTEGQVTAPQSALDILSAVLRPALQKSFGELQATNFVDEMFKDVSQTAFVAVQQYFSLFAAVLSAAYRMSELCVMALQGIDQVAMLFRSGLYNFAGERFLQRNLVTSTCALVHSTSLSPVRPLALHV